MDVNDCERLDVTIRQDRGADGEQIRFGDDMIRQMIRNFKEWGANGNRNACNGAG